MSSIRSKYNTARLLHINWVMSSINEATDDIYEGLVDRDFDAIKTAITDVRKLVKDIEDSLKDEV
jgi:hypothetical protein